MGDYPRIAGMNYLGQKSQGTKIQKSWKADYKDCGPSFHLHPMRVSVPRQSEYIFECVSSCVPGRECKRSQNNLDFPK